MGSYIKKASSDAETRMGNLERARGQAAERGQLADVDAQIRAHKPTRARLKSRPTGIARAADKLSKEDMSLAPKKGPGKKAAKKLYSEKDSVVDAVKEVLGLGNKWDGMQKMPDTDKTKTTSRGTHPYKTQKTKITRLSGPRKKDHTKPVVGYTTKSGKKVMEDNIDEKNWIKGAIKKPGALHRDLDVPQGEKIPASKLKAAAKKGGKVGQRARLAQTLKKMHNEYMPENGDHPPKKAHKHDKKKDKPEQGKVYALTGKSSDASIARGDSWKDSEVKK